MLRMVRKNAKSVAESQVQKLTSNTQNSVHSLSSNKMEENYNIKDNMSLTHGNIQGCLKRYKTFCSQIRSDKPCMYYKAHGQNTRNFSTMKKVDFQRKLSEKDVEFFTNLLGQYGVNTDEGDCKFASTDWFQAWIGNAAAILSPKNVDQVVKILQYCNENSIHIVPQGGNTGLVCSGVPVGTEVILSMRKMNNIIEFDEVSGVLSCESGALLESLQNLCHSKGFEMPYDQPSRGSCTIGGNISTNAGGINYVKHGPLRANIVGLEVVLADGTVLDMMGNVQKDSTGPDLKHLFIQGEGTLGVITKCTILCKPLTREKVLAMVEVEDYDKVVQVLQKAKKFLGRNISGIEYMERK